MEVGPELSDACHVARDTKQPLFNQYLIPVEVGHTLYHYWVDDSLGKGVWGGCEGVRV